MILIDGYPIDIEISADHTHDAEATKFPVEKGGVISDHIVQAPVEVEVEGMVSDTPIGVIARDPTRAGDSFPSKDAYARLRDIQTSKRQVTIETSLDVFEGMSLIHLSAPRAKSQGTGFHFNATFRQITIVENERTTVRVAIPIAQGKEDLGTKEGEKKPYTKEQQEHDKKSIESVIPPGNHVHFDEKSGQWQLDGGAPLTKTMNGGIYQYDEDGQQRTDVPWWYSAGDRDAAGNTVVPRGTSIIGAPPL